MVDGPQRVAFCPHCGNRAPQRLRLSHEASTPGYSADGKKDALDAPVTYFIAECMTCGDLLLYLSFLSEHNADNFEQADLVYPHDTTLHESVPETIRTAYDEGARIKNAAPNAYAVMIRRALEQVCDDRGVKEGSLQTRLRVLVERGEIPPVLAEMTTVLRTLGNVGAHAAGRMVTVPMTWHMDRFFRALVEHVYVAPTTLARFRAALAESEREVEDDD